MNEFDKTPDETVTDPEITARGLRSLRILRLILSLEALVMAGIAAFYLYEMVTDQPESWATAIALFVLIVLATVWIVVIAVSARNIDRFLRGPAVLWQVLQIAIGVGAVQPPAQIGVALALFIPSIAALVFLLGKPLGELMRRRLRAEGHA